MVPCNAVELTEFETVGPEISNFVFRGGKIHGTICMKNCRNMRRLKKMQIRMLME